MRLAASLSVLTMRASVPASMCEGVYGGGVGAFILYSSDGYERGDTLGVRPVVVLKSNVQLNTEGLDGTSAKPWTLK